MKRHAKASTAGSTMRQASRLGRFFRGDVAGRAVSSDADGSGARSPGSLRAAGLLAALGLIALLALASLSAPALAAGTHEYLKSFGPDGTEATGFGEAGAVAVDQGSDVVYVLDTGAGALFKFDLEANPVAFTGSEPYVSGNEITGLSLGAGGTSQVAVDSKSHTFYVISDGKLRAFEADGEAHEFTAGPGAGTSEIGDFGVPPLSGPQGVAVDVNGAIYADNADFTPTQANEIKVYAPSGAYLTEVDAGTSAPSNLAVDSTGNVYARLGTAAVYKYLPSHFPVTATTEYTFAIGETFVSSPAHSFAVNPLNGDVYVAERIDGESPNAVPRLVVYDEEGKLVTSFAGPGEEGEIEESEGVGVDAESGGVFVADIPASGPSQVEIFAPTVDRPTIQSHFASRVTGDSATLGAVINPNTLATTYHFEYGLGDCSVTICTSLPSASIGSGYSGVEVSSPIAGLQPATTYHLRVVAENSLGTSEAQRAFTTQGTGLGFQLGDSRAWEMVSPPDKFGARLTNPNSGPMQAAEDGNGLAYQSVLSVEEDPESSRAPERSEILARRVGSSWRSKDLTPPHTKPTLVGGLGNEYRLFSPDLSSALLEPRDDNPLSPQASGRTPYLRANTEPATYTPLVTAKEGFANVPPGTELGSNPNTDAPIHASGANRDLTHVVLRSTVPLVPGAEAGSLYEWSGGQLLPVSALPVDQGGEIVNGLLGADSDSVRNAISTDGSRVFWSQGLVGATTALYLRDLTTEETLRLDTVQSGPGGPGEAKPVFQGASADGSVALFTDSQQLTEGASPEGADLYRCELAPPGEPLACDLTDITAPRANPGESAEVLGILSAFGEDATKAYFVARGVLDTGANEAGESASPGEPNLYLWQEGASVRYVATLSEEDRRDWGGRSIDQSVALSAASSPEGRYLTFMSQRSLTGYENRDANSGELDQEVFRYDATADSLACVSCNPTGASPEGEAPYVNVGFRLSDPQGLWQDRGVAAVLPQARTSNNSTASQVSLYRPRAVLDNGRIFFNAIDSLVPADSNGQWDVYQWEPTGVGGCTASTNDAASVRSAGGCVSLLSSGTAEEEAGFLDASATGDDVFFLTTAQLSVTDVDDEYDAYDARVNGVPAVLEDDPECLGEACQPAATAPQDLTPGTATFRGPGNLRPQSDCATISRRARRLRHRSRALRRHAKAGKGKAASRHLRRRAKRISRKANALGKRSKRCRRANRRASR